MDAKITLSFDKAVINEAKKYAVENNISLSRLTEFIYRNMAKRNYKSLEALPIAEWVSMVSEGQAVYLTKPRGRKKLKEEYFKSKR